jgi:hypothetical protein
MKDGEALCPGHADAPATPQPSAPVVACKAPDWCGIPETGPDVRSKAFYAHCADGGAYVTDGTNIYCSRDCQFPKLPPLAAKPAEAKRRCPGEIKGGKRCALDYAHAEPCKPAEQPKPTAKGHDFSDPYCRTSVARCCKACGITTLSVAVELPCVAFPGWRERYEANLNTDGLTNVLSNDKHPERIAKPQMAHSSQWADEAEDA